MPAPCQTLWGEEDTQPFTFFRSAARPLSYFVVIRTTLPAWHGPYGLAAPPVDSLSLAINPNQSSLEPSCRIRTRCQTPSISQITSSKAKMGEPLLGDPLTRDVCSKRNQWKITSMPTYRKINRNKDLNQLLQKKCEPSLFLG